MFDCKNILRVSSDPNKCLRTMELHRPHHTIQKVLEAAERARIAWPLPDTVTNGMLIELLFLEEYQKTALYVIPDYAHIHAELARKGTNLTILWEESCARCHAESTVPYMYSYYCEMYNRWMACDHHCVFSLQNLLPYSCSQSHLLILIYVTNYIHAPTESPV